MTPLVPLLFLGFFLGMRHATDADHVVAVTTIVSRERSVRGAAIIGMLWGLGHTATILLVGGAILVFGLVIPPRVGLTMEFSVAVMLVLLGGLNLAGFIGDARRLRAGVEPAAHAERGHAHGLRDSQAWLDRTLGGIPGYAALRPFIIGVVHGLAGSAAVALLVLTTVRAPWAGVGYLLVFGLGTVAGMMVVTAAMAVPMSLATNRFQRVNRYLGVASGLLSVLFGAFLVYQIGVVDGLFTADPRWSPH